MQLDEKVELYASIHFAMRAAYRSLLECSFSEEPPRTNPTPLSDESYRRIVGRQWLDDEAICAVCDKLSRTRMRVLNSHFYRLLQNENYESAVKWFNNQIPARARRFCVAVNLNNSHWVGFYVDIGLQLILASDSLGAGDAFVNAFVQFVRSCGDRLQLRFGDFERFRVISRDLACKSVSSVPKARPAGNRVQSKPKAVVVDVVDLSSSSDDAAPYPAYVRSAVAQVCPAVAQAAPQVQESLPSQLVDEYDAAEQAGEVERRDETADVQSLLRAVQRYDLKTARVHQQIRQISPNLGDTCAGARISPQLAPRLLFQLNRVLNVNFTPSEVQLLRALFYAKCMPVQANGSDCGVFTCAFLLFCAGCSQAGTGGLEITAADEISGSCAMLWRRKISRFVQ